MTDDQRLDQELRRRAEQVALPQEWARTQLLPAVDRAISLSPERVQTSRLAPVAAVAGLGAILLLMVVALPRLLPGSGSTPSPSGSPPGAVVLTAEQFAHDLAAGELDGRTVLVRGQIVHTRGLAIGCMGPIHTDDCLQVIGALVDAAGARLTSGGPIIVASAIPSAVDLDGLIIWSRPAPPIEGLLVLSVDRERLVIYLGRVRFGDQPLDKFESGMIWTAQAAAEVDRESIDLDEVLLVNGWLNVIGPRPCPSPSETPIAGLPVWTCGVASWLTDVPPASTQEDPTGGLRVQSDAVILVNGDRPWDGPAKGRYVVGRRLFGGGCGAAPPCWGWYLLGVMSIEDRPLPQSPGPTPQVAPFDGACGDYLLHDETGLVTACDPVTRPEGASWERGATNPGGDRRLFVSWTGGACIDHINIEVSHGSQPGDYDISITEWKDATSCEAIGFSRHVLLDLSAPISAESVTVHFSEVWPTGRI